MTVAPASTIDDSMRMTALPTAAPSAVPVARAPMLTVLRFLLLAEAVRGRAAEPPDTPRHPEADPTAASQGTPPDPAPTI